MKPSEAALLPMPRAAMVLSRRARAYEIDFLPAALKIIERPASPLGRGIAAAIGLMVAFAILWACLGRLDVIVTAPGKITPVGNSKLVQPFETGIVTALYVADGDHVEAGRVLVELDPVTALAERDKQALDLSKTRLEIARLEGLRRFIAGQPADLVDPPGDAPADEIAAAGAATRAQALEQQAKLEDYDQQIIGKTAEERLVEQQHEVPGLIQHRNQAAAAGQALIRQRDRTRAEFEKTVLTNLAQARQKAAEFEKERDKAAQRLALLTLRAPIDGTVQQLAIHTLGGVVTPAQALMVVVPDGGGLVVEAHIQNKDVGFVHAGQEVQVKVETFTFTRYGLITGRVLDVSRDAVEAAAGDPSKRRTAEGKTKDNTDDAEHPDTAGYVAHVALERTTMMTEGGPVDLGPGMSVTAEVKTGRRRVISYLLSPILRYRQESLRER
jgi:hemolysin D